MKVLLRAATIIDPDSTQGLHKQTKDILLENGIIKAIADSIDDAKADQVITSDSLHVSQGWFDTFAHFCDPGEEYKEDLHSGNQAAAAGGFTSVCLIPSTSPVLHSKSEIEYIRRKTESYPVEVHPFGAVSRNLKGREITEMVDMRAAGALAFTEGAEPLRHPGLMLRSLQYVKPFNGVIINVPLEKELAGSASIHEGETSTLMGMPGIPDLAESLMVQRDIELCEYTNSKVHFAMLSTSRAVQQLRKARKAGIRVTAGVAAYQLLLNDTSVSGFDSLYKVNPPLRGESDRLAILEAVKDGTIDLVCSNHIPQHEDGKKLEFEYASAGINGLETSFAVMNTALSEIMEVEDRITLLTSGPRKVFGLNNPKIEVGAEASLTLFDPEKEWIPQADKLKSRARNNPFIGKKLKGAVLGICNRGQFVANV
ncbi:MAG: dihydroorotase [Limisphaerales bacterium]|jgi:dihydroorotase